MAGLFGGRDLFGNTVNRGENDQFSYDFAPTYENPQSGTVDQSGAFSGNVPLNPYLYATQDTANRTANTLGGTVGQTQVGGGPVGVNVPERNINFAGAHDPLNAGLDARQLGFATKGRYNADTGQYDKEPEAVVRARLLADLNHPSFSPPPGQPASPFIGQHPMNVGNNYNLSPLGVASRIPSAPGVTPGAPGVSSTPTRGLPNSPGSPRSSAPPLPPPRNQRNPITRTTPPPQSRTSAGTPNMGFTT